MFMLQNFKSLAEQDETGVGVLGPRARFGFNGQLKASPEKRRRRVGSVVELNVAGQARVVGKEMAQGNETCRAAGFAADNKTGKQVAERLLQVEVAVLIVEHSECCGNDDLGEAGYIVDRVWLDRRRVRLVCKVPKAVDNNRFASGKHSVSAAGKCMRGDGVREDTTGARKVEFRCGLSHDVLRSIVAEDAG